MKIEGFEKIVDAQKNADNKLKMEQAAKKEIAQQESLFAKKVANASKIDSKNVVMHGVEINQDVVKDKNGETLFVRETTKGSSMIAYTYFDKNTDRMVVFYDYDGDGNMDQVNITNSKQKLKDGEVYTIQGFDYNDDGVFDSSLVNLVGLGYDTCKLH